MNPFTTSSPKEAILEFLQPVTKQIRAAMERALPEACKLFGFIGLPVEPGKPYDRHYFAYTMRVIAKRNLAELGVEAEIEEEESSIKVKVESVALGGLVLKTPGFVIRVLKPDAHLELPRAASERRALFYEQQIPLPFPEISPAESNGQRDLGIVYLWDVNAEFTKLSWSIALPMNRDGDCFWKVRLEEDATDLGTPVDGGNIPSSRPLIAAVASFADSDLDYTPKSPVEIPGIAVDHENRELRKSKRVSNGA
jgi:hypothetical protein